MSQRKTYVQEKTEILTTSYMQCFGKQKEG